jgi:hypothetical protein
MSWHKNFLIEVLMSILEESVSRVIPGTESGFYGFIG